MKTIPSVSALIKQKFDYIDVYFREVKTEKISALKI